MKAVFIDPPMSPSKDWTRFAFSDIVVGSAGPLAGMDESMDVHVVGAYSTLPAKSNRIHWNLVSAKPWHLRNIATQLVLLRKFGQMIGRIHPDVIYSPDYFSLAVTLMNNPNSVPVLTTPGSISERIATYNPYDASFTMALKWARNRLLKNQKTIILATSEYMAEWWMRDGFARVGQLPLPVTVHSEWRFRSLARRELGWTDNGVHLLYVASLREENRVEDLAQFFSEVHRATRFADGIILHVVGEGPQKHRLAEMAKDLPIKVYGAIPYERLWQFYSAATCLVVSRRFNAIPRVAMESLVYGTPVIANQNPSLGGFEVLRDYILQVDFRGGAGELVSAVDRAIHLGKDQQWISHSAQDLFEAHQVVNHLGKIFHNAAESKENPFDGFDC